MIKKITKEPLVHFLLAGFLLFVYFKSCSSGSTLENTIQIDKETMLNYMQFQSKAFNREVFEDKFDQFSEVEKQQLIKSYIQEEVMYREAVKLGLDQNDFVIKRRVIQKMEFILNDFDQSTATISEDSMKAYYLKHTERYFQPDDYTFTHIFFKNDDQKNALNRAITFMKKGQFKDLSASESLAYGDRFLYHRNYAEKTNEFLESQFGTTFIKTLATIKVDRNKWQGPIESEYGQHWVKLINKTEGSLADLEKIYPIVKGDYVGYLKQVHKQMQIEKLIAIYDLNIDL